MNKRVHQRMDAYFKEEAEDATVITVRITEQKSTYKVEMTMPYMGHTLRTENQEREISLPALDKGIDVLERQMKKLRTRLGRDLRKKPVAAPAEVPAEEPEEKRKPWCASSATLAKPMSVEDAILEKTCWPLLLHVNNIESARPRRCIAARTAALRTYRTTTCKPNRLAAPAARGSGRQPDQVRRPNGLTDGNEAQRAERAPGRRKV